MNAFRTINQTLTAAQTAGAGTQVSTTRHLLEALSINEADSALGMLADALLHGGDYMTRNAEDMADVEVHADMIRSTSERIAEAYENEAAYCMQPVN